MKETEFNALTNYPNPASALAATVAGDKFLLSETQIFQDGTMPSARTGKLKNSQQQVTALRHKIHYYVRDDSSVGYHPVYDILESDILTQESKTATRRGKNRAATRDDDDGRDIISDPDWA